MKNFKFKKEFGQNFIFDGNLLSAIVSDSEITEEAALKNFAKKQRKLFHMKLTKI